MIFEENLSPLLRYATQTHLKEATPYLLGKLLQPLYLSLEPDVSGTVFLLAKVHPDGHGDYLALLKAAWALQKAHPKIQFELVFTYARPLPEVNTTGLILHPFLEHPDRPILEPILRGETPETLSAESILAQTLYERMKQSLALVHIALAFNTFDNPLLAPKSLYFSEAGNFQSYKDSQKFNWFSMGLGILEEGIFLNATKEVKENHNRYVGYITKNAIQVKTFRNLVKRFEGGKDVEILNPSTPLPFAEFQEILANSGPLVGCTGDGSLSECLALGKIPYYEFRPHKAETLASFIRLSLFLGLKDIEDYFRLMADLETESSEALYAILTRPTFALSWKKIIDYIHTWCRLEDSLIARLRRQLYPTQDLEADLAHQIISGKMTFDEAFNRFKAELRFCTKGKN